MQISKQAAKLVNNLAAEVNNLQAVVARGDDAPQAKANQVAGDQRQTGPAGEASSIDLNSLGDLQGLVSQLQTMLTKLGGTDSSLPPTSPTSSIPPTSTPLPTNDGVVIIGNRRRPRTLKSFFEFIEKRGIQLPFDPKTLPADVLKQKVPANTSVVFTQDGQVLGMQKTSDLMQNDTLGLGGHLTKNNPNAINNVETTSVGGNIEINGEQHSVIRSYLKSPIMLDLNHDGQMGVTGVSTAQQRIDEQMGKTVYFDIDGDGDLDETEWMNGNGDGMLVDDSDGGATAAMNGNGQIDGTRLFGDQGGQYANGYDKLALRDTNHDGKVNGAELDGLKTWVDDGDAKVEAGELKTMAELGITELDAGMHTETNARGEKLMRSSFTQNGEQHATEDVWFRAK